MARGGAGDAGRRRCRRRVTTSTTPRAVAEAIEEMSWDVRRWLLFVSPAAQPEAQALLSAIGHWALLSTCDHDGVVSSYRMLKGLSDAPRGAASGPG